MINRRRKNTLTTICKPRFPYTELKHLYFKVDGCLYNALTCDDTTFKQAFHGYRSTFPSPLDSVQRWELLIYSSIPIFHQKSAE